MTKYKCNHKIETIILDNNEMSLMAYFDWRDSVGFNGDKSMCWDCWCKEQSNKGSVQPERTQNKIQEQVLKEVYNNWIGDNEKEGLYDFEELNDMIKTAISLTIQKTIDEEKAKVEKIGDEDGI